MKKLLLLMVPVLILSAACKKDVVNNGVPVPAQQDQAQGSEQGALETPPVVASTVGMPLDRSLERVTKKPFAIYITKQNSPVSPERFVGYHVGTDFEAFPEEADTDVQVKAICDGKLLQKRTASGYGGLAVQACTINNQAVTVVYGHLKLSSIGAAVGTEYKKGETIGILGKGYSTETDNERKHLHLGIHKGSAINIAGYVQSQSQLSNWLDFQNLVK
ncbi:MAG: M23 family metallopeptidase [Candidatus Doudnabacteria bacterium]|nr:M23 family metallopeptidase [Candidatus Doudnabacteria bacterium]